MKHNLLFLIIAVVLIFILIAYNKNTVYEGHGGGGHGGGGHGGGGGGHGHGGVYGGYGYGGGGYGYGGVGWGYPYWALYPDCNRDNVINNCVDECKKGNEQCEKCFKKYC